MIPHDCLDTAYSNIRRVGVGRMAGNDQLQIQVMGQAQHRRAQDAALGLKPYGGFINPDIIPAVDKDGNIVDYVVEYTDDYLGQMLEYGRNYSAL